MNQVPGDVDLERFRDDGFVVVSRLLDADRVEELTRLLETRSGRTRADMAQAAGGGGARAAGLTGWTVPDGVTRHSEFWPIIFEDRLTATVRRLLGPDARFLQHTDLHVGFSSFNWHRDSVARRFGVGSDWDEDDEPYRIVRVGIYLQSPESTGFRLGLIPATHRPPAAHELRRRRRIERSTGPWAHLRRVWTGRNPEPPTAVWAAVGAGDAVIFDPRVIHTGTPVDGPKYSVFLAYGQPNRHYVNHWYYYRHLRPDLGYQDPPPALIARLEAAGLYFEPQPPERPPEGASIPSGRLSALARRLRFS